MTTRPLGRWWFGVNALVVFVGMAVQLVVTTFTLIRGAINGFYPHPFMDPSTNGYLRVTVNLTIIAAVFVGLAFGAHALDGRLTRRQQGVVEAAPA